MANYKSLKTTINANVKRNGNQEITGQILNSVLNAMVDTLGTGYSFAGVATPATNPGTPDAKVFYIANGKGSYNHFGKLEVTEDEVVVLYWDSLWHKVSTGIAREEILTELGKEVATKQNALTDTDGGYGQRVAKLEKEGIASQEKLSELVERKLDSSSYDNPADVKVVPVEGKVEDTFMLGDIYTQYNTGQTFRNKTTSSVVFNKIRHRLVATSESDVIRVYKVAASLWNGNSYDTAKYSNSEFTKIYEKTFGDTSVGFKDIDLDEKVTLGLNESLYVVVFGNSKTSVSLTSTYVQNDRSYGYPCVFCLSQDVQGTSVNISYGWNEYSCYPLILTQVNPYFLKKDAASIEKRLDLLDESLMYIDKLTNNVERTGVFTKLLENVSVGKNQPYHLKVSAFGGSGKVQIQFNYNDGQGYDVIEDKDIFSGFDGLFVPKRASSNGYFQVYTETASRWQSFTIEFYKKGSMPLLESIKNSDIRDVVRVLSTDTEIEIFNKMYLAFSRGNCDVVFDCATYIFSDIYIYMRDTLGWTWTMGLPIGNGCRYFFNGSTLISNAPAEEYTDSRNLLDCKAIGTDYELHDGTLINNGGTYCVHDEGVSDPRSYRHLYHNIIFNMDGATSCFGCGLGYRSVIEFDGCVFLSNTAGAVHGPNPNAGAVDFTIVFKNTYFADYTIALSSLLDKTRDNLKIIFCNNSYRRLNAVDFNVMMFYNNEVRTS